MARYDFGGTLADFVVTSRRLGGLDTLALSSATLTFWSAQSGGTAYTDLQLNGSAVSSIVVGTDGQVPTFQGPDAVTVMWVDGGSGRVRIVAQGIPGPAGPGAANSDVAGYVATGATKTALDAAYAAKTVNGRGVPRTVNRADYASLALALTAAGSGGTVSYPDDGSTWDEAATTISTPVNLRGRARLRKTANGAFITITAPNVVIHKGINIDGNGSTYTGPNVVVTGNGSTSFLELRGDITNSQQWAVDFGIGAGQNANIGDGLFNTRNKTAVDGAMTAGSAVLTSATMGFVSTDVGKYAFVQGALSTVQPSWYLISRIVSVDSATQVTLADTASVTVSGKAIEAHFPAFRFGAEYSAGVTGDRRMVGTHTGGVLLADLGGVQTLDLITTNSRGLIFSDPLCAKVSSSGSNRYATSGGTTFVRGINHTLVGGAFAGDIVLGTDSNTCVVRANVAASVYDYGVDNDVTGQMMRPFPPHSVDPRQLSTTSALAASQAVYLRARGSGYISKIATHVGVSSGNVCVGVFANGTGRGAGATPGVRKGTSGSVACPVAGYAEIALTTPVYVEEGDWLAIVADNATASFYRCNTGTGFGSSLGKGFCSHQNSAFPLPATATPLTGAIYSVILVGVA